MAPSRSIAVIAALGALALVSAECPNACSGHGDCGKYDQCTCYRNWQGNDCSLRTCQFGVAHVDSPKGDLDGSNDVTGPDETIVVKSQVYPMGTTEQFPPMTDTAGNELENSAHGYMECSNKGTCDRKTGTCACFVGYEGVACQRASCNLNCNGHGVCKSIRELALLDSANSYELWDSEITMGCSCDKGWYGPDCSLRTCKKGTDPLYLDAPQTLRTTTWELNIAYPTASSNALAGNFSIRFFDREDEDWFTSPIPAPGTDYDEDATCDNILAALRALPNKVVPSGDDDVTCTGSVATKTPSGLTDFTSADAVASGLAGAMLAKSEYEDDTVITSIAAHKIYTFTLEFPNLPGVMKQPEVEYHLDSVHAPTMYSTSTGVYGYDVLSYWSHGATIGEDKDYVSDLCKGVTVTVKQKTGQVLSLLDSADNSTTLAASAAPFLYLDVDDVNGDSSNLDEIKKLKACLGDADVDPDNNNEIYNWDYGSDRSYVSPHLIKLVNTDGTEGGRHAMLSYVLSDDDDAYYFVLLNDIDVNEKFYVYTTTGYLQAVHTPSMDNLIVPKDGFAGHVTALGYYGDRTLFTNVDASCEFSTNGSVASSVEDPFYSAATWGGNGVYPCLNKGDIIYLARVADDITDVTDGFWGNAYAKNPNLNPYVIKKISVDRFNGASFGRYTGTKDDDSMSSATVEKYDQYDAAQDPTPNRYRIVVDKSLATTTGAMDNKLGTIYHFTAPAISSAAYYHHTAECSNRGLCNTDLGLCTCFKGYTNDNCDTQSALAL